MVLGVKLVIVTLVAFSLLAGCSEQRLSCDDSSVTSRVAEILKGRAVAEFSYHCLGGALAGVPIGEVGLQRFEWQGR